ncbi:hypothetical protein [Lutispora thermophila]|uniref:Uncharacterized protein n=1 Tax=Lutispora thermophila DSM 19022 TaxID=1122184 RepID=A0A1M6I253_9FIRM|nr:hypothetical protein [Lutispora thermophila]SHJ28549.1 hypothetical protein SAMN02745176_03053 [Lutispora thermophila DSM 19022]
MEKHTKTGIKLPKNTDSVILSIYAERKNGKILDVYLDNIKLWLSDEFSPYIEEVTITEIEDMYGNVVPLKKDEGTDSYLDNWINPSDRISGTIKFNEPVEIMDGSYLKLNAQNVIDSMINVYISPGLSDTHNFSIIGAHKLKGEDNYLKLYYESDGTGPFNKYVRDKAENNAVYFEKPNIDKYRIRVDNASPMIITPQNRYESYEYGRTSVDIVVREESRGVEQSPVILTYYWTYVDNGGNTVEVPAKTMMISNTAVKDDVYTTYTAKIDIPHGSNIPPYQKFTLVVDVTDEARYGNDRKYFKVNQKDESPPAITWDKSIYNRGTENEIAVDISEEDGILFTKSGTVSFSVDDQDSGIEEVRYSWTREPYREGDSMNKVALPAGDGKYYVEGTSTDTPLEGIYYLNIMAINGTDTHGVSSKPFYFDNEGPRGFVSLTEEIGHGIDTLHYSIYDKDLQNKFLYTILKRNDDYWDFEPVTEPDISEGIKDNGMWRVMEIDITDGTTGSARITDMLNKIEGSGFYKVVARFYDGYYNWSGDEYYIVYDFDPPTIEVVELGEPEVFKKRHEVSLDFWPEYVFPGVVIQIEDTSYVNLWDENFFSVKWVNVETGEEIPAEVSTMQGWVIIGGNDSLSGRYYIRVYAKDHLENSMNEMVFMDGKPVEFCFDNSPPTVDVEYDKAFSTNIMKFAYSDLEEKYTDIAAFRYGITSSPEEIPFEWTDIDAAFSEGEVTSEVMEGTWYLHIYLEDTLGNEQTISFSEQFIIDMTKPEGSISFTSGYTNKLDTALKLEIEELKTTDNKTFKTILSEYMAMLEDEAIGEIPASQWKNITFEIGNVKISYTVTNNGTKSTMIGTRILLDMMLGDNDGCSISLDGNTNISYETKVEGSNIPMYWRCTDSVDKPKIVSYGFLKGWGNKEPDSMIIAHWSSLSSTKWDYEINPQRNIGSSLNDFKTADSAAALYWGPKELETGKVLHFETYYGLGNISDSVSGDTFSVNVMAPSKLDINGGIYENNPFDILMEQDNSLGNSADLAGINAELILPAGLELAEGEVSSYYLYNIPVGQKAAVAWKVKALNTQNLKVLQYMIRIRSFDNEIKSIKKFIIIPGFENNDPDIGYTDIVPRNLYYEDEESVIHLVGYRFERLKDKTSYKMSLLNANIGTATYIAEYDIAVINDNQIRIKLPNGLKHGNYKLSINHRDDMLDYTLGQYITVTTDAKHKSRNYGIMAIKEENAGGKKVHKAVLYENESQLSAADKNSAVLIIRGKIRSISDTSFDVYGDGIAINNGILYKGYGDSPLSVVKNGDSFRIMGNGELYMKSALDGSWEAFSKGIMPVRK